MASDSQKFDVLARQSAWPGNVRELKKVMASAVLLAQAGGVISRAVQALGLSRQALYRRMER